MRFTRCSVSLMMAVVAGLGIGRAGPAGAQTRGTLQGQVTDQSTGRPIEGAAIIVLGTTLTAGTDASGRYTVPGLPPGTYTVRAVRIGYSRQENSISVAVGQSATHDFAMAPAAIQLDEIVVTGTPDQTEKRTLGNAVASLKVADLTDKAIINDVQQVLLARTPGLSLTTYSGQAGASSSIKIRG